VQHAHDDRHLLLPGRAPTRKPVFRSWLVVPALLDAMQTTVPTESAAAVKPWPVQPSSTKMQAGAP
jgi:hypothetical protein